MMSSTLDATQAFKNHSSIRTDMLLLKQTKTNRQTNKNKQEIKNLPRQNFRSVTAALFRELFLHRKWHLVVGLGQ
jgi:hypothetical protein